jgi:hypothetical protein
MNYKKLLDKRKAALLESLQGLKESSKPEAPFCLRCS